MKAVVFHQHGGIDVLRYEDIPVPAIGSLDVLLKVKASACNYNDIWARRGMPGMTVKLPHISGTDVAGEVEDVGKQVSTVNKGDKVLIHPGLSCRSCEYCTSGREYFCRKFEIYGFQTGPLQGGHAEWASIPASNVVQMPGSLPFAQAAALPSVLVTAWHMLVTRAQLSQDKEVLIMGAAGGLGTVAVQMCKAFGAMVIGVVGSQEKADKVKSLGADHVIVHTTDNILEQVARITGGRGVDIIFEHSGSWIWSDCVKSLARGGTLVTCGATSGFDALTDLRYVWTKQLNLIGSHVGSKAELVQALRLVEKGKIKPVVQARLPLSRAGDAQIMIENRKAIGKIVLVPPGESM